MPLTREMFATLILAEPEGRWEIICGRLREKPAMSSQHNLAAWEIVRQLVPQIANSDFQLRQNGPHLLVPGGDIYIPDLFVVPSQIAFDPVHSKPGFETFAEPMPFVVEIWSPSTGSYDIDRKLPGYQARGDLEIWRLHPVERALTTWRRQPDGSYTYEELGEGKIMLHAVPGVTIDLNLVFALR